MTLNLLQETANEEQGKKRTAKDRGPAVLFTEPVRTTPSPTRPSPAQPKAPVPREKKSAKGGSPPARAGASGGKEQPHAKKTSNGKQETVPQGDVTHGVGVNLLTGEYALDESTVSRERLFRALLFATVGTLFFVGVVFGVVSVLQNSASRTLLGVEAEIQETQNALALFTEQQKEIRGFLDEVEVVKKLLGQHVRWTKFLAFLERVTLRDVYYTNLSVNPEGVIRLSAIGRDFTAVARQLLSFEHADEVERVRMANASAERLKGEPAVLFGLELSMKPELIFSEELPQ